MTGDNPSFIPGMRPATVNQRFVIRTPFKNRKTGKVDKIPILNYDGHLDVAHKMGLVSLTSEIISEWCIHIPAGLDEYNNPKVEENWWVRVKATAVVLGPHGQPITATGFNTSNDRDSFIKKPEYLLAVAETRAMKRALYNACGITEEMINPDGKEATRESVDLPLHPGDEDEPESNIPAQIRRNVDPPLTTRTLTHPLDSSAEADFGFFKKE